MIKNRAPETAKILKSIPSWGLRWGILVLTIIVSLVIISSIELIHFQYKLSTNARVSSESLIFNKSLDKDVEEIEYILIGDPKPIRVNNLHIVTNEKNIIIKISPIYLSMLDKGIVKVDLYIKKSLFEIIMGDFF